MLGLASLGPEIVDAIEQQLSWLQKTAPTPDTTTTSTVNVSHVHREIRRAFHQAGEANPYEYDFDDRYEAMEIDLDKILDPHLVQVAKLLDKGEAAAAAAVLAAIFDAFIDGLTGLDDYLYEDNEDTFYSATQTLDAALAEVLLSLEMAPEEKATWGERIAGWEKGAGDLEVSRAALAEGWTFPPLVAIMRGDDQPTEPWPQEIPDFAARLDLARLRILARQGRRQAYISLAMAAGQARLAIIMMARIGEIEKAIGAAKVQITSAAEMLEIAQTLAAEGALEGALDLAAHGLSLAPQGPYSFLETGRLDLARWTREQALVCGNQDLALRAARIAFEESGAFRDYLPVQEIGGNRWMEIRPDLLAQLRKIGSLSNRLDIYLHENLLGEAMTAVDTNQDFILAADLHRVVTATRTTTPDWGIRHCRAQAEAIMAEGRSGEYDTAVTWLRDARDIYTQHGRLEEWKRYLDGLLKTHHRKYKLVPMLRQIR